MRFSLAVAAFAPVLSVYGANILVQVGAGGQLAFSPPNITAQVGDVIAFQFQGKNHSVTQSTFATPCAIQTSPQGIDSGFQFVAANATQLPEWSFTVNNASAPLWFFCAQTIPAVHCQAGMVFSVNANPDSAKSFAAFQAAAMNGAASGPASAAGAAASGIASAAGAAASGIASGAGSLIAGATSAIGSAAGAAATDAAGALTSIAGGAAAALTGAASPSASGNSTAAPSSGGRVTSSAVSLLAVVGLGLGMLL